MRIALFFKPILLLYLPAIYWNWQQQRFVSISTLHTNGVPSLSSIGISTVGMLLFQLVWLPLETTFKASIVCKFFFEIAFPFIIFILENSANLCSAQHCSNMGKSSKWGFGWISRKGSCSFKGWACGQPWTLCTVLHLYFYKARYPLNTVHHNIGQTDDWRKRRSAGEGMFSERALVPPSS